MIGQALVARELRGDILAVLGVLQFIVITRRPVGVTVFGECPECGVYVAADPLHVVTGIVAGDKCPVVVHGEELVSLLRVVPDTGVDDHFLSVIDVLLVGDADLLGGIEGKVLLVKLRALHQVHPGGCPVAGRGVEAARGRTRQIQGLPVYREVPLALVRAGPRDGADHRSVTRLVGKRQLTGVEVQILLLPAHRRGDVVLILPDRFEGPLLDITVLRHQQHAVVVQHVRLHHHIFAGKALLSVDCFALRRQGCRKDAAVLIGNAEGFAVELVGILLDRHAVGVGQLDVTVLTVIRICIKADSFASIGILEPLVLPLQLQIEGSVAVGTFRHNERPRIR